jgi:SAM-dependent methyltransferase
MGDIDTFHVAPTNAEQSRAWDGDEGAYWAANAEQFDRAVAGYHQRLLDAAGITPDSVVLDVGCGTGQTTRDAARLAPRGRVVGLDLSSAMLSVARGLAAQEGTSNNVEFWHVDAQVHPLPADSFDVALSRTGTMFFGEPEVAFANIARALRAGGHLAMVAWQPVSENEWIREISTAMAAGRDLPAPPPDAPGPFSLSDAEPVRRLLAETGYEDVRFEDVRFEDLRAPMHFGDSVEAAHRFVVGLTAWMLEGLDEASRRHALDDLEASMRRHLTPRGVEYSSAMWLVTARKP